MAEETALRPFHETIVEAIRCPQGCSVGVVDCLVALIKATQIPKGHDEIIAAIDERWGGPGFLYSGFDREIAELKASILKQKQEASTSRS